MNRIKPGILFASLTFAAGIVIGAIAAPRLPHHRSVSWQQSESPMISIGVRDKYGDLRKYTAVFIVTGPDGKKRSVEKKVANDSWGYVGYPKDFSPEDYMGTGSYKWRCNVNGKTVTNGSFRVSSSANGQLLLTITTK